ncbi:tRNA pseudouridine(55) synthase TruB [Vallitalea sp.]|jgi:tRNA pseudouridine55 synthase|uniref:tRNA pseudouridine(55) synthase TruB n=1 Tax=Vallitalea sp. TaxID=1882829 RepID=UPI0025F5E2C8|nr:tRNA pseudouridine(55) synthase TruB [Vallitalea sp.]MCT4687424.1 tRNA pseudouridine(55) synthase TruB [Vallitalea sp.]
MNGIINVYKEKGYTSFDVVAILRKKLKIKKIGHTGTLDPEAEGVLPVCVGKATKVADYITDTTKTYLATMTLGIETDTEDHTGNIISEKEVTCSKEQIEEAVNSFIGDYSQIPPMYSALKVNGKRLYQLAREGKTIERKARNIYIYNIDILNIYGTNVEMEVKCSKGTYIRTLCADIGTKLGCGAHMSKLIRTQSSLFSIDSSIKLDEIDNYIMNDRASDIVTSIDKVFLEFNKLVVSSEYDKFLYNGNKLKVEFTKDSEKVTEHMQYRIYDEKNNFIGIYQSILKDENMILKPIKLFL